MAEGPMRQSIPLSDTIRQLSGDASGLASELRREREKLEREIRKSLDSAGRADVVLTQKLSLLRQREAMAKTAAISNTESSWLGDTRKELKGSRKALQGVFEVARGGVSFGSLRDVSEVLEGAGTALAESGHVRSGVNLVKLSSFVSAAANIAGAVGAVAATFYGGMALGQAIGNYFFGDPEKMLADEQARGHVLDKLEAARGKMSDAEWWKMAQRARSFDDPAAMAASMANYDAQRSLSATDWRRLQDETANETKVHAWRWTAQATIDKELVKAAEIKLNEKAEKLTKQREAEKVKYLKNPERIRDRAIAQEKVLALRSWEEEKKKSFDWSGY